MFPLRSHVSECPSSSSLQLPTLRPHHGDPYDGFRRKLFQSVIYRETFIAHCRQTEIKNRSPSPPNEAHTCEREKPCLPCHSVAMIYPHSYFSVQLSFPPSSLILRRLELLSPNSERFPISSAKFLISS